MFDLIATVALAVSAVCAVGSTLWALRVHKDRSRPSTESAVQRVTTAAEEHEFVRYYGGSTAYHLHQRNVRVHNTQYETERNDRVPSSQELERLIAVGDDSE